jgi:uncharacterized protein YcnI
MSKSRVLTVLAALAATSAALPASAHIVLAEPQAKPGAYYAGFFRLSHGCGASPTTAIRIEMPEGVVMAKPQPKPGWTVSVDKTPLPKPVPGEGGAMLTERVTAITWRGRLGPDEFDQFGIMMKLPQAEGSLYFPTMQTCEAGGQRWTDIPAAGQAWHDVPHPAPVLQLVPIHAMSDMANMHHDH